MTEENNPGSEAVGLPPASRKTKEQWLEEGKVLMFHAPIRYEEALAAFEQAISLDPNSGLAYRMKGRALHALRRHEEALAVFEQALHLDPTSVEAADGKATSLTSLHRDEEALASYAHVIRLDGDPFYAWMAHVNSRTLLASLCRYEEALAHYHEATRR